jgi:hypothetical protein
MKILDIEHGFHSKVIAIGFDGVCVRDAFPRIGGEIGASPVLKKLTDTGHRLILYTVRYDCKHVDSKVKVGEKYNRFLLRDALLWFEGYNIPLWAVNDNPETGSWSPSGKLHADLYIDNKAIGAPLISSFMENAFIDWSAVDRWLERGCYYWSGVR